MEATPRLVLESGRERRRAFAGVVGTGGRAVNSEVPLFSTEEAAGRLTARLSAWWLIMRVLTIFLVGVASGYRGRRSSWSGRRRLSGCYSGDWGSC